MDKVRIAMLGTGGIANKHAGQSASIPEVEIVGLCDVSEENMQRLIERSLTHRASDPPPQFKDTAEMYDKTKPDAVVICTPHTMHYDHCAQALDRGIHVLIEKPMVTELSDAIALEKKVHETDKVLCIAYNTPCTVEFYKLREITRNGELGKLKVVSMYLSQPWYHFTKGKWRQDPKLSGGGQLYDSGAHALNSLCWVVENDVEEVHAYIDRLDTEVDINGTLNVKFANGCIAAVAINGESPSGSYASFMFENGKVDIDPWGGSWIQITDRTSGKEQKIKYPTMTTEDSQPLKNFVDAILGRDEARTTVRNGVIQSQLMDAVYASDKSGQPAKPKAD